MPAPPTIRELLDGIADRFGLALPLATDLFTWGTDQAREDEIQSALYISPATIDGVATDRYAFRQEGVDWQVWIEKGKTPLPRKLVITTTDEDSQPQYAAVLKWNLSPDISDKTFEFVPPKDSYQIVFAGEDAPATN